MSNEEQIEEILWEAHSYNVRTEVMGMAKTLIDNGVSKVDAYQQAFNTLTK
tara:strand:+ start:265 stop:417 length:153 start_codon:yes stop_codon:yes gene_type:complete